MGCTEHWQRRWANNTLSAGAVQVAMLFRVGSLVRLNNLPEHLSIELLYDLGLLEKQLVKQLATEYR